MKKLNDLELSIKSVLEESGNKFNRLFNVLDIHAIRAYRGLMRTIVGNSELREDVRKIGDLSVIPFCYLYSAMDKEGFEAFMDIMGDINYDIIPMRLNSISDLNDLDENDEINDKESPSKKNLTPYLARVVNSVKFGFLPNFNQLSNNMSFTKYVPRMEIRTNYDPAIYSILYSNDIDKLIQWSFDARKSVPTNNLVYQVTDTPSGYTPLYNVLKQSAMDKEGRRGLEIPNRKARLNTDVGGTGFVINSEPYNDMIIDLDTSIKYYLAAKNVAFRKFIESISKEEINELIDDFINSNVAPELVSYINSIRESIAEFNDGYTINRVITEGFETEQDNTFVFAIFLEDFMKQMEKYDKLYEKYVDIRTDSVYEYLRVSQFSAVATTAAWYKAFVQRFVHKDFFNRIFEDYSILTEKDLETYFHKYRYSNKVNDPLFKNFNKNKSQFIGQELRQSVSRLFNLLKYVTKDTELYKSYRIHGRDLPFLDSNIEMNDEVFSIRNLNKYFTFLINKIVEFNTVMSNFEVNITKSVGSKHYYENTMKLAKSVIDQVSDYDLKNELMILGKENDGYYPMIFDTYNNTDSTVLENYKAIGSYYKLVLITSLKVLDTVSQIDKAHETGDTTKISWLSERIEEDTSNLITANGFLTNVRDYLIRSVSYLSDSPYNINENVYYVPEFSNTLLINGVKINKHDTKKGFDAYHPKWCDQYGKYLYLLLKELVKSNNPTHHKNKVNNENWNFYANIFTSCYGFMDNYSVASEKEMSFIISVASSIASLHDVDKLLSVTGPANDIRNEIGEANKTYQAEFINSIKNTAIFNLPKENNILSGMENYESNILMPVIVTSLAESSIDADEKGREEMLNKVILFDEKLYNKTMEILYANNKNKTQNYTNRRQSSIA